MKQYAVFEVAAARPGTDEPIAYVEGTAADCVAALAPTLSPPEALRLAMTALESLPLEVLSGVEFEAALRRVKRLVGVREAAERAKEIVRGGTVHHAAPAAEAAGAGE